MSARQVSPAARARVSQLIVDLVADEGGAAIGRLIGHAKDTAPRRGGDLALWPIIDVLELAMQSPDLRDALVELLTGKAGMCGEAIRAQAALFTTLQESAALVAEASRDLADGRIDTTEAKRLLPMVRHLRDQLADEVLPALEAFNGR